MVFLPQLTLLACQSDTGGDTSAGPQSSEEGGEQEASGEVDVVLGPGSFDLTDTGVGLDELATYATTLTISFDGTKDGQPHQWSITYDAQYVKEPLARLVTITQAGDTAEGEPELPALLAEMDGVAYEVGAAGSCNAGVFDPQQPLMELLDPAGLLLGVFGAEEAGQETVDGIAAAHYTFDERALVQNGRNESSGEMWVATDGGFIVRYLLSTGGMEEYFGGGLQGTLALDYQLTDVNQPRTIELPADCPPGLVSAPLLADATNVASIPGLLQYDTATDVLAARAFYEQELTNLGWQPPAYQLPEGVTQEQYDQLLVDLQRMEDLGMLPPPPAPDPNQAFLVFELGDQLLHLLITLDATGTHVTLALMKRAA